MKIIRQTAPYIRKKSDVSRMMFDVLIAMIPSVLFSIFKFGIDALIVFLVSISSTLIIEYFFYKLVQKDYNKPKIYAGFVTATIFALIIPSQTELYTIFIGILFAILIGKLLFGGMGNNIVNPAALGRIIVTVSFTSTLIYPLIPDASSGATALADIKANGINVALSEGHYTLFDLFIGNIPGSMGEVSALAILIGAIYLFVRKSADIRPTISFILTFVFLIFVASLTAGYNSFDFTMFHLLSGGVLFGAVFMVTDPVSTPISQTGRIIFGMYAAAITVFIRLFGAYPEGVAFSILIMNLFTPSIDYYKWSNNKITPKFIIFAASSLLIFTMIIGLSGGAL